MVAHRCCLHQSEKPWQRKAPSWLNLQGHYDTEKAREAMADVLAGISKHQAVTACVRPARTRRIGFSPSQPSQPRQPRQQSDRKIATALSVITLLVP